MTLEQARRDFAALLAARDVPDWMKAAGRFLGVRGAEALRIDPAAAPALPELIRRATSAPASPAQRNFAVLVLDALAVPGLLLAGSSPTRLERDVCALLEQALPHALARSGYPFGGDLDARRRHLTALAPAIDDYLRPLEPSIPTWLSGRMEG
jgi:hypothetical protein